MITLQFRKWLLEVGDMSAIGNPVGNPLELLKLGSNGAFPYLGKDKDYPRLPSLMRKKQKK
jgi:hypothetical protein